MSLSFFSWLTHLFFQQNSILFSSPFTFPSCFQQSFCFLFRRSSLRLRMSFVLSIKLLEAKTLPETNRNRPLKLSCLERRSGFLSFWGKFLPFSQVLCHALVASISANKKNRTDAHLRSPHQRPSGHRLNLVPGYPSSTLRNKRSSTKRENAKNPAKKALSHKSCQKKLLVRSVCVFSGP